MSRIAFRHEFSVPAVETDQYGVPIKETQARGPGSSYVRFEDGGQSMQIHPGAGDGLEEDGMFVRLMSWHEGAHRRDYAHSHLGLSALLGKRVRITVEILD